MRILLWHGYLLGGTGSNVYTRALAREWSRAGHDAQHGGTHGSPVSPLFYRTRDRAFPGLRSGKARLRPSTPSRSEGAEAS